MENPKKIFINYRRKDARGLVKKYYQCLKQCYGDEIFFDESIIEYGDIIPEKIKFNVKGCRLFLVAIGPNWENEKYLSRLNQAGDWVRQELELAKAENKPIIPVLIDRDNLPVSDLLPESLKTGIFDRNAIELSKDDDFWQDEIRRHQEVIKHYTGLEPDSSHQGQSSNKSVLGEDYIKLTYCLDRSEEKKKIEQLRKFNKVVLSGTGSSHSRFEIFAEHFGIDGKEAFISILPGALPKQLSWENFSSTPTDDQPLKLCNQINAALSLPIAVADKNQAIENLRNHFNRMENGQRFVFFAIRLAHHQANAAERVWWKTWHDLLTENSAKNILVFLFAVPGLLQRLNPFSRLHHDKLSYIGHFEDTIKKDVVDSWALNFKTYLQNTHNKDRFDRNILDAKLEEFFGDNKSTQYSKALEHLQDTLTAAYRVS